MAGPMLIVGILLSAVMVYYILGYQEKDGFNFITCCMFGSIISATDPVAVVALLKQLGASKRLSTMIEGESLLNDGTAMVAFTVFLDIAKGLDTTPGAVLVDFLRLALGGAALGYGFFILTYYWILYTFNDYVLETNLTIVASYMLFYTAESLKCSGILAIVTFGIQMSYAGKFAISPESHHANHHIWGYLGFMAETLIFMFAGVIMGGVIKEDVELIKGKDVGLAIAAWFILLIIRYICIFLFYPCLSRLGYGFTINEAIMVSYGGLRGAVGLALAIMVHDDAVLRAKNKKIGAIVLLHTSIVALMTLVVNAPTTGILVNYLGLADQTEL
jgi:sodium/hydrogen exchanger 10/11